MTATSPLASQPSPRGAGSSLAHGLIEQAKALVPVLRSREHAAMGAIRFGFQNESLDI